MEMSNCDVSFFLSLRSLQESNGYVSGKFHSWAACGEKQKNLNVSDSYEFLILFVGNPDVISFTIPIFHFLFIKACGGSQSEHATCLFSGGSGGIKGRRGKCSWEKVFKESVGRPWRSLGAQGRSWSASDFAYSKGKRKDFIFYHFVRF